MMVWVASCHSNVSSVENGRTEGKMEERKEESMEIMKDSMNRKEKKKGRRIS